MLKKLKQIDIKQVLLTVYIIINVLYSLIGIALNCYEIIDYQKFSYGLIVFLVINVIIMLLVFILKKYKYNTIDYFLLLMCIVGVISMVFAYNSHDAMFGFKDRYEGYFQILYYITILFLSSFINKKNKKYIVYAILFTGVIETGYGILQVTNIFPNLEIRARGIHLAKGLITNANFYSTYILISLCYALGLFLDANKKISQIIYLILTIFLLIGLLISNTLSTVVGFIGVIIFITIYCIKNKYFVKYLIAILAILLTVGVLTKYDKTYVIKDLIQTKDEVKEISKGNFDDQFGTKRMLVWKKTIPEVPKNLLHGIGIDNIYYLFDGKPLTIYNGRIYYDKVHNEYLQVLLTQGLMALLIYLGFYILLTFRGIKNCFKEKTTYLLLPVGAYLIQAFFNISVIEVAPLFYIACGILIERNSEE